jgi:MFS transporter, FLVCR family, feline leukemia virus subgroup C receptor-related protein
MEANPLNDEFKVYPKRYLIVFLFGLAQFMTSCLINTLTPIAKFLEYIYGQDPIVVNSGALLFALMYPIFTFPASFVIDTYGTRAGIAIGCGLCLVGTGFRMLVNNSFAWVIVGQVIAGIGRPFILNCQAKIGASWFEAEKRAGVTQLLTLILNVSLIIGIFIPGMVFGKYDMDGDVDKEVGRGHTFDLMFVEFILAILCLVPNLILQQSKPPTPPSDSAGITNREPFKTAIPKLLRSRNYLLLLFAFGCYFGIFNGLSMILSFLLAPWFKDNLAIAVGYVGGSPVISGIIGVVILGPMQRKSGNFKKYIVICMLGIFLAT